MPAYLGMLLDFGYKHIQELHHVSIHRNILLHRHILYNMQKVKGLIFLRINLDPSKSIKLTRWQDNLNGDDTDDDDSKTDIDNINILWWW